MKKDNRKTSLEAGKKLSLQTNAEKSGNVHFSHHNARHNIKTGN